MDRRADEGDRAQIDLDLLAAAVAVQARDDVPLCADRLLAGQVVGRHRYRCRREPEAVDAVDAPGGNPAQVRVRDALGVTDGAAVAVAITAAYVGNYLDRGAVGAVRPGRSR